MLRILFLIIGYAFGLIQTGVIMGKIKGTNLKEHGSGNTGATNAMRVMGAKSGAIVFVCDFLKCFLPVFIIHYALAGKLGPICLTYAIWCGIGSILGHSYPFFLGFKGGKGVACACALGLAIDWRLAVPALIVFIIVAVATKYVSLASMLALVAMLIIELVYILTGFTNFLVPFVWENFILLVVLAALIIFAHRSNIVRLIHHNENKFSIHKK